MIRLIQNLIEDVGPSNHITDYDADELGNAYSNMIQNVENYAKVFETRLREIIASITSDSDFDYEYDKMIEKRDKIIRIINRAHMLIMEGQIEKSDEFVEYGLCSMLSDNKCLNFEEFETFFKDRWRDRFEKETTPESNECIKLKLLNLIDVAYDVSKIFKEYKHLDNIECFSWHTRLYNVILCNLSKLAGIYIAVVNERYHDDNVPEDLRDTPLDAARHLLDKYINDNNKYFDTYGKTNKELDTKIGTMNEKIISTKEESDKENEEANEKIEENVKKYSSDLEKCVLEIRNLYDEYEYKNFITPRYKHIDKMDDYMRGALNRQYMLKIPLYSCDKVSKNVKEIIRNDFIPKISDIADKYHEYVIFAPVFDDESNDMYIYLTLREPFGDAEDSDIRETDDDEKGSVTQNEEYDQSDYSINRNGKLYSVYDSNGSFIGNASTQNEAYDIINDDIRERKNYIINEGDFNLDEECIWDIYETTGLLNESYNESIYISNMLSIINEDSSIKKAFNSINDKIGKAIALFKDIGNKWKGVTTVKVTPEQKKLVEEVNKKSESLCDKLYKNIQDGNSILYEGEYEDFLETIGKFNNVDVSKEKTEEINANEIRHSISNLQSKFGSLSKSKSFPKESSALYIVANRSVYVYNKLLYGYGGWGSKVTKLDKYSGENKKEKPEISVNRNKYKDNKAPELINKMRKCDSYQPYKKLFDEVCSLYGKTNISTFKTIDIENLNKLTFISYSKSKPVKVLKDTVMYYISDKSNLTKIEPSFKSKDEITFYSSNRIYLTDKIRDLKKINKKYSDPHIYECIIPRDLTGYRNTEFGNFYNHNMYVECDSDLKVKDITSKFNKINNTEDADIFYDNSDDKELNEATISTEERKNLKDSDFGVPEIKGYPLTDEAHIRKAIQFFNYCKQQYKETLAKNIVKKIIYFNLVGNVTISDKNPAKKYFPSWMLSSANATMLIKGKTYEIYVDGKKVEHGQIPVYDDNSAMAETVLIDPLTGQLYI